jgi:hypothetical protein
MPPRILPQDPEIAGLTVLLHESIGDSNNAGDRPRRSMTAIRHTAVLGETPVREMEAPMRLNVHNASYLQKH